MTRVEGITRQVSEFVPAGLSGLNEIWFGIHPLFLVIWQALFGQPFCLALDVLHLFARCSGCFTRGSIHPRRFLLSFACACPCSFCFDRVCRSQQPPPFGQQPPPYGFGGGPPPFGGQGPRPMVS